MANKIWDLALSKGLIQEDEEEIGKDDNGNPIMKKFYKQAIPDVDDDDGDKEGPPPELKEICYPCRFFNYKKKVKSDYNYIKTK